MAESEDISTPYSSKDLYRAVERTRRRFYSKVSIGTKEVKVDEKHQLVVAAIDFGTSNSGCAYFVSGSHCGICYPKIMSDSGLKNIKLPTSILLYSDKSFRAFGYEAQQQYCDHLDKYERETHFYFEDFKMNLHHREVISETEEIKDIQGKGMKAIDVFSLSIEFLKDTVLKSVQMSTPDIVLNDVRFVLTVPAIWRDSAKLFMRKAAEKAGISKERLLLALEPEAASIYCQSIMLEKRTEKEVTSTQDEELEIAGEGTNYLVIDVGGGTSDFSIHRKVKDGKLLEIHKPVGDSYGGRNVDEKFINFFENLFGKQLMEKLKRKESAEYLYVKQGIEKCKQAMDSARLAKLIIRIPMILVEWKGKNEISRILDRPEYRGKVFYETGKLQLTPAFVRSFFDDTINGITSIINTILAECPDVTHALLVGGFSDCSLLREKCQQMFKSRLKLFVPECSVISVLNGAVLFGRNSGAISPRILRFSYYIDSRVKFDQKKHQERRRLTTDYGDYVSGSCKRMARAGLQVESSGYSVVHEVYPAYKYQTKASVKLYYSDTTDEKVYVDEECHPIGSVVIPIEKDIGKARRIEVSIVFGLPELEFSVKNLDTGKFIDALFQLDAQ